MYQLDGKVALVTGAGGKQGIGRSIATDLLLKEPPLQFAILKMSVLLIGLAFLQL
ncbi:MAG: hypothetical protein CM1200mP39_14860 [Dehalococcoidia bacterium]|nr:MAG: hypothetical protein CM1200mP39_14860 [Dehalococcoidia bacterium]